MQVASNEICRFIGAGEISKQENTFYFCNVADETGETLRAFCDQQTYFAAKGMTFGDNIKCVWDIFSGRNGIGVRLKGVIPWSL